MDNSTDNFDPLKRLLGCKRYEQPPPGYFVSFSDRVLARIETEEAVEYSSWWSWFIDRFDAKPVLVCMYGLAVSSLLFLGFRLSQLFDSELAISPTMGGPWLATAPGSPIFSSPDMNTVAFMGSPATGGAIAASHSSWTFNQDSSGHLLLPSSPFQTRPALMLSY